MKIAFCLEYPIDAFGGTEVLVRELIKGFSGKHEIVLVSNDTVDAAKKSSIGPLISEHIFWDGNKVSPETSRELALALAQKKIDLAHFHSGGIFGWGNRFPGCSPFRYLAPLGVPCLSTVHLVVDVLNGYCGPQKPNWFKLLMLPLAWCGKADQLRHTQFEIAVSQHDFQKLCRWYRPFQSKFRQLYHSRLHRESDLVPSASEREQVILNVGHIAWRKGQLVLAEAFALIAERYPEWKLQFIGEEVGTEISNQIRQIAKVHRLEDRILLMGPRNDVADFMRKASVYVQPSFWEALGLALQEAMFYGCPAIGSRAGGIPELIEEGRTGLVIDPGNASQLADALDYLIRDEVRRKNWGQAAAASIRSKGMTAEGMVERHLSLYEVAVGTRHCLQG